MKQAFNSSTEELGLLANGSSGLWNVAIDESLDGKTWSVELDGPHVYVVFQVHNLEVIPKALGLMQATLALNGTKHGRDCGAERTLDLGRFGSAAVSLVADNEDFPRCFIVVGPKARSTFRLSLEAEDIRMISDALQQVLKDMPQTNS